MENSLVDRRNNTTTFISNKHIKWVKVYGKGDKFGEIQIHFVGDRDNSDTLVFNLTYARALDLARWLTNGEPKVINFPVEDKEGTKNLCIPVRAVIKWHSEELEGEEGDTKVYNHVILTLVDGSSVEATLEDTDWYRVWEILGDEFD